MQTTLVGALRGEDEAFARRSDGMHHLYSLRFLDLFSWCRRQSQPSLNAICTSDKCKHFQDDPCFDPEATKTVGSALTNSSRCKHLILGAGSDGLLLAVRLMQANIELGDLCMVDSAGDYGGTWYCNHFPGLLSDVAICICMPLSEEMNYMLKPESSYGPEPRKYSESIAERWDMGERRCSAGRSNAWLGMTTRKYGFPKWHSSEQIR